MSKNIMIISTTLRQNGNSKALAEAFSKGAAELGHHIENVTLYDKTIHFCKGCLSCQQTGRCFMHDDADKIVQKMRTADVLVFATPIYYYEMCGQMKTLLDRSNPLFPSDYAFRDIYLLATAADTERSAMDRAINGLQGWISCFEKAELKGVVCGLGADGIDSIRNNPAVQEAYEMGKTV